MEPVDVVYPLGIASRWGNNELRFSLRALEKNFLDLGRVFVCTVAPPSWLTGATILPVPDNNRSNKDANLIDKLLAACNAGVSDRFIRSSDDEMILAPMHADDMRPYHCGPLGAKGQKFWNGGWKQRMRHTFDDLIKNGETTFHFDSHLPKVYRRDRFIELARSSDYKTPPGYCIDTWYLNRQQHPQRWQLKGEKLTLERPGGSVAEIRKILTGRKFLGYNDNGLTPQLKAVLLEMFPNPSRFESDGGEGVRMAYAERPPVAVPTVVAVLGSHRSGSSCIAGMIHALGISVGSKFQPADNRNPTGYWEGLALKEICSGPKRDIVHKLRKWAIGRGRKHGICGGKYFKMCRIVPQLAEAWPGMKAIVPERPIDDVVRSMTAGKFGPGKTPEAKRAYTEGLIADRDRDLGALHIPTLRLNFSEVIANPRVAVDRIIAFTGISPSIDKINAAVAFVNPDLLHFRT